MSSHNAQRAGAGAEPRPSLTSKLRDALGQALRSKHPPQPRSTPGAQGATKPSASHGPGQGAAQGNNGLQSNAVGVALVDVAAAGGVSPRAAAAAVEGITLSASTLQEVLQDLWGREGGAGGPLTHLTTHKPLTTQHSVTAELQEALGWDSTQASGGPGTSDSNGAANESFALPQASLPQDGHSSGAAVNDVSAALPQASLLQDGQGGAEPRGPGAAPWAQGHQGSYPGPGNGLAKGPVVARAPSELHAEWREKLWYPIFGQCPSPTPAPPSLRPGALPPPQPLHPQPIPALPLLQQQPPFPPFPGTDTGVPGAWEGVGGHEGEQGGAGEGGDEGEGGAVDFQVGLEQLDAAFGELQELLDSLQEPPPEQNGHSGGAQQSQPGGGQQTYLGGGQQTYPEGAQQSYPGDPFGPVVPQAQQFQSEAQSGTRGSNGGAEGSPWASEGLGVDWSLGTPLEGMQQALEGMRVGEGVAEQQGSAPMNPLAMEHSTGEGAVASSADVSGVMEEGERSYASSQSKGAASAAGVPQAESEPIASQATGNHARGQRRRRREDTEGGTHGAPPEDAAAGRSTALRTGAAQAGAEAAAFRGAAAAARARLRLNELQSGTPGAGRSGAGAGGTGGGPVALLEAVATAIAKGQEEETQRLLEILHEVSSQYGDAAQRVAAYCLQGFLAALPPPAGAPAASPGPGPARSSSSRSASSASSSSASGSEGSLSHPPSAMHRSPLLSLRWLDRAMRPSRGLSPRGVPQVPGGAGAVGVGVGEGEAVAPADVDCEPHVMKSFQVLMSATPLVSFGHVTANCALLEATAGAPRVHLVDLGTGHGLHLVPLLRAMAARPSGAPTVHLTLVDVAATDVHRAYCVIQTSLRLKNAAEQFGLQGARLTMDVVYVKLEELQPQHVAPRPGYTCVVNCTMRLSQHLEGALAAPVLPPVPTHGPLAGTAATRGAGGVDGGSDADSSATFLPLLGPEGSSAGGPPWSGISREEQACRAVVRLIKALRPAVCVCVEYRVEPSPSTLPTSTSTNTLSSRASSAQVSSPHLLSRFLEAVHHSVGVFESLDASVGREHSHEQRVLERDLLGRTIAASVACHGHWHRTRLRAISQQQLQQQQQQPQQQQQQQLLLQEQGTAGAGESQKHTHSQRTSLAAEQGLGGVPGGVGGAGPRLALGVPSSEVCPTMLLSERLRRGGLLRRAVSSAEVATAQQLLSLYRDGFGLRLDEPNSLTLTWKGRALLSSSAWML